MTAEEIIQRLLDERKITVKEAMILLKAILKVCIDEVIKPKKEEQDITIPTPTPITPQPTYPWRNDIVVCYGCQIADYPTALDGLQQSNVYDAANYSTSACTYQPDENDQTITKAKAAAFFTSK